MPRKRKPVESLKETGTYRPSRHAARTQAGSDPKPLPAASTGELLPAVSAARAELVKLIGPRLAASDEPQLVELAERLVEVRRLRLALHDAAPGDETHTRITRALTAATASLDRLALQFGLSPSSRTALPEQTARPGVISWQKK